jgi:3-hexulose-6-phosphate synthase/6-phospho-3-hexuloisomerase
MEAVRTLKNSFPQKIILADMKVSDTGALEVEMASKAGADIVMVLAGADDSTIIEAVKAAKKYGVKIMADLISVSDPVLRSEQLEKMGVDYINMHAGSTSRWWAETLWMSYMISHRSFLFPLQLQVV